MSRFFTLNRSKSAKGYLSTSSKSRGAGIMHNMAFGGVSGAGGSNGQGIGGGVYSVGTFTFDALTVIKKNNASTSNDNIFT